MIYLDDIRPFSNQVRERAQHCSAVKIGLGVYRVSPMTVGFPQHAEKSKRRVTFGLDSTRAFAICSDYYTGETCPANEFGRMCAHVLAAQRSFLRSMKEAA